MPRVVVICDSFVRAMQQIDVMMRKIKRRASFRDNLILERSGFLGVDYGYRQLYYPTPLHLT
jgi:hypothetical protein